MIITKIFKISLIIIITYKSQAKCKEIKAHSQQIRGCDFSQDSRYILSCSNDKTIKIWNFSTQKFIHSFSGHSNWVRSSKFSPDVRLIASASDDKTLRLWDIASQSPLEIFTDHNDKVYSTKFHPDGTILASGGLDGKIKLWDLRSKALIQHYEASEGGINEIAFHPSGKFLGSVSEDKAVKIWDLREGRLAYTLYSHEEGCQTMAFSQDGEYFATGGGDKLIFVWKSNFYEPDTSQGGPMKTTTIMKPSLNMSQDMEPMNRSGQLENIEEMKNEEDSIPSPKKVKETRLKEILSGHLEKIVFQLGQITENIERLDHRLTQNEEIVQNLMNDDRVKPFLEERIIEGREDRRTWEGLKTGLEEKRAEIGKNMQNIFSIGALATTGMIKELESRS